MRNTPFSFIMVQPSDLISSASGMLLKFRPFQTSQTWKFVDPDTSRVLSASSQKELIQLIVTYRSQNQLPPIEELDKVLEHYLCTLPENTGKCCSRGKLKRGLFTYIKGGMVLLQNLMYSNFVSDRVAEKRAEQCVACPLNVFPDKGPFVKWSDSIASNSVGDKRTKHYEQLGNCAMCSCVLNAKVWYAGKVRLTKVESTLAEQVNCWQLNIQEK